MSDGRWWIRAEGRVFGPYGAARLPGFRDQGRLAPATPVSRDEAGPFIAAADTPELAALFGPAAAPPAAAPEAEARRTSEIADAAPGGRTLLVFTDAAPADAPGVETALGAHGVTASVRPGLWLVRGAEGAAPVRNALSRGLTAGAMLLVVEAPLSAAAWFNLGEEADRALRRLWTG